MRKQKRTLKKLNTHMIIAYLMLFCTLTGLFTFMGAENTHEETAEAAAHTCTDACKQRLHTHVDSFDETVHTYTCNYTGTWYRTYSSSGTQSCGHQGAPYSEYYYCKACGEQVYYRVVEGCRAYGCSNYERTTERTYHPGAHSYQHVGVRYECTETYAEINDYTVGYGSVNGHHYCAKCGFELYHEISQSGITTEWDAFPSYHYYYVKTPLSSSCYTYGDICKDGYASGSSTSVAGQCWHEASDGNWYPVNYSNGVTKYTCSKCRLHILTTEYVGHGCTYYPVSCYITTGDEDTTNPKLSFIGRPVYFQNNYVSNQSDTKYNTSAMHRTQTFTCTQAEYGPVICDQVVTSLVPLAAEQTIGAGGTLNARATATFLNGTVKEVTCQVSGYDSTKYNVWQNVTLSYGTFSSVSNKSPRTAAVRAYVERVNFDVNATSEDANKGTVTGGGSHMVGTSVTVSASAAAGYSFAGWYQGSTLVSSSASYTFTMPTNNVSLVAKFSTNSYTFAAASETTTKGTITNSNASSILYKTSVTVGATAKTGFSFAGWYEGNTLVSANASYTFNMPARNVSLTARFNTALYTVSFDSLGGSACSPVTVSYLGAYGNLPIPTRNGYVFGGWKNSGGNFVTSATAVTSASNHTLTAHWLEAGPAFILVNYGNQYGNNNWSRDRANIGSMGLTEPRVSNWLPYPSKTGYSFLGWFRTENSKGNGDSLGEDYNVVTKDTIVDVAGNDTLHAGWTENSYTLSFDSNGGTACSNMTITYDRSYGYHKALPVPSKSGYVFGGWYTSEIDNNGIGTQIKDSDRVQAVDSQTLYAKWESADVSKSIVVTYLPAGTQKTYTYPGTYNPLAETPSRAGYSFVKWVYNNGTADTTITASTPLQAAYDHSVNAVFTPNNYTLYLDQQGATENGTTAVTVTFDAALPSITSLPKKTGYQFMGYYTGTNGTGEKYYDAYGNTDVTYTTAGNRTVYAYWEKMVTITYNANGGSGSMAPAYVPVGSTSVYISENEFTRTGYDFVNWNTEADGSGTTYLEHALAGNLTSDLTLYAQWKEKKNVIIYDANGGTGYMANTELPYDVTSTTLTPNRFTRPGYTFAGWADTPSGGVVYGNGASVTVNGTKVVYAVWTETPLDYILVYRKYPFGSADTSVWKQLTLSYTQKTTIEGAPYVPSAYQVKYDLNRSAGMSTTAKKLVLTGENTTTGIAEFLYWEQFEATASGHIHAGITHTPGKVVSGLSSTNGEYVYLYPAWNSDDASVVLPPAEQEGYTFIGWSETADGSTAIYTPSTPEIEDGSGTFSPAKDTTLYAQWEAKQYIILLNFRGATGENHTDVVRMTFDKIGDNITPPIKTGYTFRGFYTGTRGTGTKYYDETGTCIKEWTEDDISELYAYWVQDEVVFPEEGDNAGPTPLPEQEFVGSIGRNDAIGLLYADDYDVSTNAITDLQPYLAYDTSETEGVIPGTELLAFRAKMGTWMLRYRLHRNTGTDYVRFFVSIPYRTQYERSSDEELVISTQQTKTYSFLIPKIWSYWEIIESGLYYPDKVRVSNGVIKGNGLEVKVNQTENNFLKIPTYDVKRYDEKQNHVFWEEYDVDGCPVLRITLTEEQYIISDVPDTMPDVDKYLSVICLAAAQADKRQARVRSDRFVLNNQVIISDEYCNDGNGATLNNEVLENLVDSDVIEETSYLQTYVCGIETDERKPNGRYISSAEIIYTGDKTNINAPESITVVMADINDLNIHTPVVCNGAVTGGMEKTEDEYVLTLKDALNFFTLSADNTGTHRMSFGYGKKNYSFAISGKSNVADQEGRYLNQVRFPFDVYVDIGNDSKISDDVYNPEDDYLLETGTWLTLGPEEQQFYVPVTMKNGKYQIKFRSVAVNCPKDDSGNYIFEEEEYRANLTSSCYVATDFINVEIRSYLCDFNITSVDATLAAEQLESGCQALTLKKGYGFSFELLTQGEFYGENAKISIVPTYFWEPEDGTERKEVKLYHSGEFLKYEGKECYAWEGEPVLLRHENYDVILQKFTGKGFVPADILCVAKDFPLEEYAKQNTFTGREEFFLQEGYLMIHFDIMVLSNVGEEYVFDQWENSELAKDAKLLGWNYIPGDIIRYNLSESIADDYEIGGSE